MKNKYSNSLLWTFMFTLVFSFLVYTNAIAAIPQIRVGLTIDVPTSTYGGTDAPKATITSKSDFTIKFQDILNQSVIITGNANEEYVFTRSGDKISITKDINTSWVANGNVTINHSPGGLLVVKNVYVDGKLTNKIYRGYLEVKKRPNRNGNPVLAVVNSLSIEDYLYGVVPREMPSSWSPEALKAQTVAARTYALSHMNSTKDFDVTATTLHQVYGGYGTLKNGIYSCSETANDDVDATKGIVAKYGTQYISALYSSNAGGRTESAKNVWGNDYPYLVSVDSHWDSIGGSTYKWSVTYDRFTLENKLKIFGIQDVYLENISLAGRADYLCVKTSAGVIKLKKSDWPNKLALKSRKTTVLTQNPTKIEELVPYIVDNEVNVLTPDGNQTINLNDIYVISGENNVSKAEDYQVLGIDIVPAKYTFNGYGYGHGVGMSQWGANGMAKDGYKYNEILKHYYSGITLVDQY